MKGLDEKLAERLRAYVNERQKLLNELQNVLVVLHDPYLREKDALKNELRATVVAQDAVSARKRDAEFQKLAESQWPRIAALEEQAEQIRREVAALPPPPRPAPPPELPPRLAAHIDACLAEKKALDQALSERIKSIANAPLVDVRPGKDAGNFFDRLNERREAIELAEKGFRLENSERYEALAQNIQKPRPILLRSPRA